MFTYINIFLACTCLIMHILSDSFLLARFLPIPVQFHQAIQSLQQRVRHCPCKLFTACKRIRIRPIRATPGPAHAGSSGPAARGPCQVHGRPRAGSPSGPAMAQHMPGPKHKFSKAQFRLPSHPGMASHLHYQLLQPLPPPQITPIAAGFQAANHAFHPAASSSLASSCGSGRYS